MVDQSFFIAMEYLDGECLARVMGEGIKRGTPMPVPLAAVVVSQMCKGLHHAHSLTDGEGQLLGLVHRDVSPQNVMVLNDGGVKLLDFGIAKARERLSETTTTGMKGKYAYMSPEQCQGLPVNRRSDIFSCGVVLWETLTRRRLFKHQSKLMVLKMITEGRVPPPSKLNPEVPEVLDAVALKALCKLPAERFGTALEMSTAIEQGLMQSGIALGVSHVAEYMQRVFGEDQRFRRGWINSAASSQEMPQDIHTSEYFLDMIPDSTTVISFSRSAVGTSVGRPMSERQSPVWWILTAVFATLAAVAAVVLLLLTPEDRTESRLSIETTPPGATVIVDGERRAGSTPASVFDVAPGKHVVQLVLRGHVPWKRHVTIAPGETFRMEAVLLALAEAGPPPPVDAAVPDLAPAPDSRVVRPAYHRIRDQGLLNLATTPWAGIYHGRRFLGNTPLVRAKLPTGTIRLRAVNLAAGIDTAFKVTIVKDQLTRKAVKLK